MAKSEIVKNALIQSGCVRSCAAVLLSIACATLYATPEEDGMKGISEYERGNLIEGMALLERSAEAGFAPAQAKLAYIMDQAEEDEKAFDLFRRAAEAGDPDGQYGLAKLYSTGEGTEQDFGKAIHWLRKSADQGNALAMRVFGQVLQDGAWGQAVDNVQALSWFVKAAQAGDVVSVVRVADIYENGELGVAADPEAARRWRKLLGEEPRR